MARYWRVSPKFWSDPKVAAWDDDTKVLALYVLTNPHRTAEGLFRLPKSYIVADLKWTLRRLAKPFARLGTDGFLAYDETAEVCLLPKALDYQSPQNANQVIAAVRALSELPPTPLAKPFRQLAERYSDRLAKQLPEGFGNALALTPPQAPPPPPPAARTAAPTGPPPTSADGGGDVIDEAVRLLAEREADQVNYEIRSRPRYVKSRMGPLREDHEPKMRRILADAPDTSPDELVRYVLGEKPLRVVREHCSVCDDTGVWLNELDEAVDCECKGRRSA